MIGLMLKDAYTITKQMRGFLILTVVCAVVPSERLFIYATFFASMVSITALAYDEQAKWNKLAAMMPYSTGEIIGSKYLIGYAAEAVVCVLSIISRLITSAVTGQKIQTATMEVFLMISCIAWIVQAINLPIMFKFGVQKGRLVWIILTIAGMSILTTGMFGEVIAEMELPFLIGVMPIIAIVFNIISFLISKMLYKSNKN